MRPLHLIWLVFVVAVGSASVYYWTNDEAAEGGGACAMMGFLLLIVLVIGTVVERLTTRPKPGPPGFPVRPQEPPAEDRQEK